VSSGRIDASGRVTLGKDLTYQEYSVKFLDTSEKKSPGITATRCVKCNGAIIQKKMLLGKKKTN
jgi:hypothetical protein